MGGMWGGGVWSFVLVFDPVGMVFPGDPGFPDNGANNTDDLKQFAPRLGIVWDPKGDTRQTIRAGIGHFYDAPKLWQYAHHMLNPPYGNTTNAQPPSSCGVPNRNGRAINFATPWANTPGGDPLKAINYPHQGESVTLPQGAVSFPQQ